MKNLVKIEDLTINEIEELMDLALEYKNGLEHTAPDLNKFNALHDDLLAQYIDVLSGEKPLQKGAIVHWSGIEW